MLSSRAQGPPTRQHKAAAAEVTAGSREPLCTAATAASLWFEAMPLYDGLPGFGDHVLPVLRLRSPGSVFPWKPTRNGVRRWQTQIGGGGGGSVGE